MAIFSSFSGENLMETSSFLAENWMETFSFSLVESLTEIFSVF